MSWIAGVRKRHGARRFNRHRGVALGLCLAAIMATPVAGQNATEPAVKSALIFNFAKFTSWPQDVLSGNADLVACVAGSEAVGQALQRAVKNRALAGHQITVSLRDLRAPHSSFRTCHLLYATGANIKQLARLMAELRGAPILTIMDVEDSTMSGGVADLFIESGQWRFQLDNGLAKQGRLELSSKLLSLASVVRESQGVLR